MKTSFIATVYNEEKTIRSLLDSLLSQTKKADEIVIVDGGSRDKTVSILEEYQKEHSKFPLKIFVKDGNRSIGRNEGIKQAKYDIIIISDAGCILDKRWVEEITKPFIDSSVEVVAGYYHGKAKTIFQKCLIPYVLIMEDRVDPKTFLPATRSMAFRKKVWGKVGGFDRQYSHNEDYVFAHKLEKAGVKRVFVKNAIAYWLPSHNLIQAFYMFYRFAKGDAEAKIWRKKVLLQFIRYIVVIILLFWFLITHSVFIFIFLIFGIVIYSLWAVKKNYRYVQDVKACILFPLIQFTVDLAVLSGTVSGLAHRCD